MWCRLSGQVQAVFFDRPASTTYMLISTNPSRKDGASIMRAHRRRGYFAGAYDVTC
jgi:hypothetical protein